MPDQTELLAAQIVELELLGKATLPRIAESFLSAATEMNSKQSTGEALWKDDTGMVRAPSSQLTAMWELLQRDLIENYINVYQIASAITETASDLTETDNLGAKELEELEKHLKDERTEQGKLPGNELPKNPTPPPDENDVDADISGLE